MGATVADVCRGRSTELKSYFGLDYSFLLSAPTDLTRARKAYKVQYEHWKTPEAAREGEIRALLAALAGKPRKLDS